MRTEKFVLARMAPQLVAPPEAPERLREWLRDRYEWSAEQQLFVTRQGRFFFEDAARLVPAGEASVLYARLLSHALGRKLASRSGFARNTLSEDEVFKFDAFLLQHFAPDTELSHSQSEAGAGAEASGRRTGRYGGPLRATSSSATTPGDHSH